MKSHLSVVQLGVNNCRDPVTTLRRLADEVASGQFGAVSCVAVALVGSEKLDVFGMGPKSSAETVHVVLSAAARQLEDMVLEVMVDD